MRCKDRSVSEIAYSLGFEYPQYFNKLFKQKTGYAPIDYFLQMKMQKACQQLDFTNDSIKLIAFGMGFDDFGGYSDAGYEYDDTSISQESLSGWYGVANVELANVLRPQIEALLRPPQSNLVTAETEYLKSRAAELAKDELEDD